MSELIRKQQKLNYRINYCSSEDKQFPASELILQSEDSIGWQSKRFSSYPQLIVIELFELSFIREVSILSHQTKITTKIQIQAKKEHSETWTRLGYTCMDSNVNNNYRCRELKKVPLNNQQALILRFTMHQNYTNNQNIFNQVSIINLSIHGAKKSTQIKQVPISLLDKLTLTKLKQLEKLKAEAIEEDEFDLAKHYNNQIKNLKETANQLMCLERNKKSALEQDNFDEAKKINQKMVRIRGPSLTPRINSSINENKNQLSHEYYRHNQSHEIEKNQHSSGKYAQLTSAQYAPTSQYSPSPHNNDEETIITQKKKQNHLNSQQYDQCQQYFEVIPKNIFQQLHSKDHIEREDGLYKVKQIIQSNVNVSKQNILSAGLYIINKMIDDKVLSISLKAISIFGVMLRKYNFQKINADQADVIRSIMIKLNPFLGHKNEKIKTLASNVYISLPKYPITNRQLCIDVLTIIGLRNPKNIIAQLGILQTIVNQYGLPKNIHKLIKFPVIFIEDRDNLVRQKAINFLLFLRDKIGFQNLLPYLQNIHPAITNVLKLEKLEEKNPKQQITQKKNSVPLTQKIVKKKKTQQEKKKNSVIERKIAVNPEYVCDYCQVMDKKLEDEDYRDIHLFKQCKMIKICPECKQAVEISQLNQHLLLECRQKGNYRRCPRCKQPIHIQQYQRHCMNKDCLPAKSFSSSNRCPLCHQDILPHKKGWLRHLVDQGCPLNNRT